MNQFPFQPRDLEGPVFNEPWEAQAFSLVIALHEQGSSTWEEWATTLSAEISRAQSQGDPDLGDSYYQHWLCALEKISASKNICSYPEMATRKSLWIAAYAHTPHGKPIELSAAEKEVGGRG